MSAARARGCRFVSVSPLRDDTPADAQAVYSELADGPPRAHAVVFDWAQ